MMPIGLHLEKFKTRPAERNGHLDLLFFEGKLIR
jgi:hypothetical protein